MSNENEVAESCDSTATTGVDDNSLDSRDNSSEPVAVSAPASADPNPPGTPRPGLLEKQFLERHQAKEAQQLRGDGGGGEGYEVGGQGLRGSLMARSMESRSQGDTQNSTPASKTGGSKGMKSFKEMLECVKNLHSSADDLQDRISRLHDNFGEIFIKAALLFTPETVKVLNGALNTPTNPLPDPDDVHFTTDKVEQEYDEVLKILNDRPPPLLPNPEDFEMEEQEQ